MPPKRRRMSTDTKPEEETTWGTPASKRRKQFNPLEVCQEIYDTIRNHKNDEGHLICEHFIRVPKRRTDPEYYMVVTTPIDMLKIQQKLKTEEYDEIEQLSQDVELLVSNAKAYYVETSVEYQDACDLIELFNETRAGLMGEIFGDADSSSMASTSTSKDTTTATADNDAASSVGTSAAEDDEQLYEQLFSAVYTAKEGKTELSDNFKLLPSRTLYPEYYDIIKKPIDLKMIATKVQEAKYGGIEDMVKDLMLMIQNAKTFNEPGSKIYKDAHLLKKFIQNQQNLLETPSPSIGKASARIRKRQAQANKRLSAICAALKSDEEKAEEESEDQEDDDEDDEDEEDEEDEDEDGDEEEEEENEEGGEEGGEEKKPERKQAQKFTPQMKQEIWQFRRENPEMKKANIGRHFAEHFGFSIPSSTIYCILKAEPSDVVSEGGDADTGADTDMSEVESSSKAEDGPLWALFNTVKNLKTATGAKVADPFRKLPNKQHYPDYYDEIDKPVSLLQIQKKLRASFYRDMDHMITDFDLMFTNARQFNIEKSKLHQDANSLEAAMIEKKNEILSGTWKKKDSVDSEIDDEPQMTEQQTKTRDEEFQKRVLERYPGCILVGKRLIACTCGTRILLNKPYALSNFNSHRAKANCMAKRGLATPVKEEIPRKIKEEIPRKTKYSEESLVSGKGHSPPSDQDESSMTSVGTPSTPVGAGRGGTPKARRGGASSGTSPVRVGRPPLPPQEKLKRNLRSLYNTVMQHEVEDRKLVNIFLCLPSRKDYPDYYQVITEPIDMGMIDYKIEHEKYNTMHDMLNDFELMFNNARHYNEETSLIYKDADRLEKVAKSKMRAIQSMNRQSLNQSMNSQRQRDSYGGESPDGIKKSNTPKSVILAGQRAPGERTLLEKLQSLYSYIMNYTDNQGRALSIPFVKLPSKTEYPEYYDVIKRPIDLQRIHQRIAASLYMCIDDMVQDCVQMFDNACRFNEQGSLIYKDALMLQRVCLEHKTELSIGDTSCEPPDVCTLTQQLMNKLFQATMGHCDPDGRCYSDTFLDMAVPARSEDDSAVAALMEPTLAQPPGKQNNIPSFDIIKRNLGKLRYLRLDMFQEDMFEVFGFARRESRTDSQLYEDAVELQMYFVKKRDEICRMGEAFISAALNYHGDIHTKNVDAERRAKVEIEQAEDEEKQNSEAKMEVDVKTEEKSGEKVERLVFCEKTYHVGDFVYIENENEAFEQASPKETASTDQFQNQFKSFLGVAESAREPHILCIEKLWKEAGGDMKVNGTWFYRPREAYTHPTRKFLPKEVFKSDYSGDRICMSKVVGTCYVMYVKEYFKNRIDGFEDKDIYVCESSYECKTKSNKKIKVWKTPRPEIMLKARDEPLSNTRVPAVFDENKEDIKKEDEDDSVIAPKREVVLIAPDSSTGDGLTYYEQYHIPGAGWFKISDHAYVRGESEKPYICRIDKMWEDASGSMFFCGPGYMYPNDTEHAPTRLFWQKEVIRSMVDDTNPLLSVTGRCVVLLHKEYISSRITEVPEEDFYICDSKYNEDEKVIRKFPKSTLARKNICGKSKFVDDEVYFFKTPIVPVKVPSPKLAKASMEEPTFESDADTVMRPSGMDMNEDSVDGTAVSEFMSLAGPGTPARVEEEEGINLLDKMKSLDKNISIKRKSGKPWQPSGYLVFSAECRKKVQEENPDLMFGDISKMVGSMWRKLDTNVKEVYEKKAKKIAAEQAAKQEAAEKAMNESLASYPPAPSPGQADPRSMSPASMTGQGMPPQHHMPSQGQMYPQHGPPMMQQGGVPVQPPPPMFVSVPPRTQRLVHSEAYIRYMEGLTAENDYVSAWDRTLTASQDNTRLDKASHLPTHWISQGLPMQHEDAVTALWALRDAMLKDSISITRTLDVSEF